MPPHYTGKILTLSNGQKKRPQGKGLFWRELVVGVTVRRASIVSRPKETPAGLDTAGVSTVVKEESLRAEVEALHQPM